MSRTDLNVGLDPTLLRGAEWAKLSGRKRSRMVLAAFEHWRRCGFPYYALSSAELGVEFARLAKQDVKAVFRSSHANGSCVGLRVANNFQPQMWSVRVSRYRCPMDVFLDDDLLRRAIERAWTIWPDRLGANSSNLRRMLKTFPHTASVSNFRPTLTRAVVERFSGAGSTILDFSAGFGGRLVGCLTLERHYIGIEPCASQVDGLRKTLRALALHKHAGASARLYKGRAECILKRIEAESVDLVFSSPPYYNWERYSEDASQSFVRYAGYDKWLTGFLEPCITESFRSLRPDGHMVLNISGRERRPSRDDVFKIAKEVGFTLVEEMPMLLARVPYLHPQNQGAYKPELLLVFSKRARRGVSSRHPVKRQANPEAHLLA